jgi:nucleoside phosphorylase
VSEPGPVVVVLTALDVEHAAIREHLSAVRVQAHPSGTIFEVGTAPRARVTVPGERVTVPGERVTVPGAGVRVALATVGEGNAGAAVLAERAIAMFQPVALFFVGIAGALVDDLALGDVVVATRLYGYHGGREEPDGFHARPRGWAAPHGLEQLARYIARTRDWVGLLRGGTGEPPPSVHFRPVAAGEVVLNSLTGPVAQQIRLHYNDAAAVEMESAGAAQAGQLNRALPVLAIRGISDMARGDKDATDRAGWRRVAARNAAAFALTLIGVLDGGSTTDPATRRTGEPGLPGESAGTSPG